LLLDATDETAQAARVGYKAEQPREAALVKELKRRTECSTDTIDMCEPPKNILGPTSPGCNEWRAELYLRFARREERTVLVERRHRGPLTVQKALYPEGPGVCHAVIIHPPGGIAGGDSLFIRIDVEAHSRAVITTPAAAKWYKAAGKTSRQEIIIRLGEGATLDWLPQENLFFNAASVQSIFKLEIHPAATGIGWDMALLGRQAAGEKWETGSLRLSTEIRKPDEVPLWIEQTSLCGGDPLLQSPQGLSGYKALGTLWAIGCGCTSALAAELNSHLPFEPALVAGATSLPGGILLLRCLATEVEVLRQLMADCWMQLRPIILGLPSQRLRLWAT
jgi:urease accessory protein